MKKWPTINGQLVLITSLFLGPVTASFISGDGASLLYPYSLVCKLLSWIYTNQPCRCWWSLSICSLEKIIKLWCAQIGGWTLWTSWFGWDASKPLGKREIRAETRATLTDRWRWRPFHRLIDSVIFPSTLTSWRPNSNEEIRQICRCSVDVTTRRWAFCTWSLRGT